MKMCSRISAVIPQANPSEISRWIEGGIAYADRLAKLPAREREAVAQLFALYGLAPDAHYRILYRQAIDVLIAPFYPLGSEVSHAPAT